MVNVKDLVRDERISEDAEVEGMTAAEALRRWGPKVLTKGTKN